MFFNEARSPYLHNFSVNILKVTLCKFSFEAAYQILSSFTIALSILFLSVRSQLLNSTHIVNIGRVKSFVFCDTVKPFCRISNFLQHQHFSGPLTVYHPVHQPTPTSISTRHQLKVLQYNPSSRAIAWPLHSRQD